MSGGHRALLARRAGLVERAAAERERLADTLRGWEKPLAIADRGLAIVRAVKKHARVAGVVLGIVATVLAVARPRILSDGLKKGLGAWRLLGVVRGLLGYR
jgi:hypothetical protein